MTARRHVRFWVIGLLLLLVLVYFLRGILLPFVAGMAIAYLLDPLCDRLEKWGFSRTLATCVVTLGFAVLTVAVLLLVLPLIQSQILDLLSRLPGYIELARQRLLPLLQKLWPEGLSQLRAAAGNEAANLLGWVASLLSTLVTSGLALFNILSLVFITPVVTFYLLRDWDRMVAHVDAWLPRRQAAVIREQMAEIDRTLSGFVRGQAMVCISLGAIYGIGLTVIGLDFGLTVGLLAGILSFIPYVGTIFGFVASTGLAFAQFPDWLHIALVVGLFFVGQVIEGNLLTPKLVGDRVGLHPVWVMFALLAGGAVFGFVGLLLAVPVAAVIGVLARFALSRYLDSPYYQGENGLTAGGALAGAEAPPPRPAASDP